MRGAEAVPLVCFWEGNKMITIADLCALDQSLKILKGEQTDSVSTISSLNVFIENSLLFIGSKKFHKAYMESDNLDGTEAVILDAKLWDSLEQDHKKDIEDKSRLVMTVSNTAMAMSKLSGVFYKLKYDPLNFQVDGRKMGSASVHPSVKVAENVFIGEDVTIEEDVTIMPGVTILPNVKIGKNTIVFPNVTIYPFVEIGSDCRIHSGTTIGADGFGYNYADGVHHKVWHFGGVKIGNAVEIGSNVSIDQGTFSPTTIGDGAKIDNLVQIAHNVEIGPGVLLCGQVGTAGSAKIGPFSVFGGKAAISDGIEIGAGVQVAGAAVVTTNWGDGEKLGGYPARPIKEWMRGMAFIRKNSGKK